jgi:hypothetical protein
MSKKTGKNRGQFLQSQIQIAKLNATYLVKCTILTTITVCCSAVPTVIGFGATWSNLMVL